MASFVANLFVPSFIYFHLTLSCINRTEDEKKEEEEQDQAKPQKVEVRKLGTDQQYCQAMYVYLVTTYILSY